MYNQIFSINNLIAAYQNARKDKTRKDYVVEFKLKNEDMMLSEEKLNLNEEFNKNFFNNILDDLQTPQAIAIMWDMLKSDLPNHFKLEHLLKFDKILGLNLDSATPEQIPNQVMNLAKERLAVRKTNDFKKSDELRKQIKKFSFP